MIIKQFKSGHPIGSSLDPSGPSGLVSRSSYNVALEASNKDFWWVHLNNERDAFGRLPDPAVCNVIRYRYALELVIIWVILPIILGLVYLCIPWYNYLRSSRRTVESTTKSNVATTSWLLLVVHSNMTCYFWITYYIIDNVYSCGNQTHGLISQSRSDIIAVIGAISLGMERYI